MADERSVANLTNDDFRRRMVEVTRGFARAITPSRVVAGVNRRSRRFDGHAGVFHTTVRLARERANNAHDASRVEQGSAP